jgi:AcrR family transcriptional regulator
VAAAQTVWRAIHPARSARSRRSELARAAAAAARGTVPSSGGNLRNALRKRESAAPTMTSSQTAEPIRTMRADARRNRERLLAAALVLFADAGEDVPLEAIAGRAGVGIGTLYRHFPTREALAEAAYRNEVRRLCDAAAELLATRSPDAALGEWMDRFVTYVAAKRSMAEMLQSVIASSDAALYTDARLRLGRAITTLLEAGAGAGTIRADVEPDDVLRAMSGIWLGADAPDWSERSRRQLGLLMDGLRYGARGA